MKDSEKQEFIDRYNERLAQFGHDPRTLGWPKRRHVLRYAILLSQWNLDEGGALLDYGCGFGDMHAYCAQHAPRIEYTGVDINPALIEEGLKRYPGARLSVAENEPEGSYDYVVSSGVHNAKLADNWAFIEETFALFDRVATKGYALNFLSNRVEFELEHTYHADPVRVLELAYRYSNRVVLRNDYMPFEFTVFVDKRNEFDKDSVVYPEFLELVPPEDRAP
jgi:SAM-dependent methyltransferase